MLPSTHKLLQKMYFNVEDFNATLNQVRSFEASPPPPPQPRPHLPV